VAGLRLSTAVILGLVVGLALAFTLVFILESIDRRIKSIEEFESEYRLSALADVPQAAMRPSKAEERTELLEPYRILRSALDFAAVARPLDSLLVTSAVSGEGKTTVCVDLAHAVALTGRRVVLLELDLRMPTFSRHFDLNPKRGLTTALVGAKSASELLVQPLPELPNLAVLPSGPIPHNPSELIGSAAITEIISEFTGDGTMVIIDAPPLNPVADAQILLSSEAINATLIVAKLDTTTRDQVRRARTILDRHMVEPVGLMITGLREGGVYGYGYGPREDMPAAEANGLSRARGSARRPLKL
jgi:capsular exopolysaccharide synthesis family protein